MNKKYICLVIIFLTVASIAAFGRIAGNDFINFDDNQYITENYQIQSGINFQTIQWAFSTTYYSYWHPLTWISHMIDWRLFGASASGHHLISLLLHIGSVILLFLFLNKTTNNLWPSAFAAAFFALHPLRVESVAWAAERKDVLSMFFGMATLYAYAFYVEFPKRSRYASCLFLFILSLMSKPMMVTIPAMMLLLDYWPLNRWQKAEAVMTESRLKHAGRLIGEKIPFIFFVLVSSIITAWAQNKIGTLASMENLPLLIRISNAIASYMTYLMKMLWPVNLAIFYPYDFTYAIDKILIYAIILMAITVAVVLYGRGRPFLFVGWFWYLMTLIPVIGFVQVGEQSMADRYTYLPSIGISIMMAWGIPTFFVNKKIRMKILLSSIVVLLSIMTVLAWKQCGYWKNSITIFSYVLQVTQNNHIAHNNLAYKLMEDGEIHRAIYHFDQAISANRNFSMAYYNRGIAYAKVGQYQRAIKDYNEAIRIKPDYVDAYNNRSISHFQLNEYQLAIDDLNKAISVMPSSANAYYNRGVIYSKLDQYQQAFRDYNEAVHLKPDYSDAYYNRGILYGEQGQYQLAIDDFNHVIRLKPDFAEAYNNRGFTYFQVGRYQSAIDDYTQAIGIKPDYTEAYMNRGVAYFRRGHNEMGCRDVRKACSLGNCTTLESVRAIGLCR